VALTRLPFFSASFLMPGWVLDPAFVGFVLHVAELFSVQGTRSSKPDCDVLASLLLLPSACESMSWRGTWWDAGLTNSWRGSCVCSILWSPLPEPFGDVCAYRVSLPSCQAQQDDALCCMEIAVKNGSKDHCTKSQPKRALRLGIQGQHVL
jgi:hypothetical protein